MYRLGGGVERILLAIHTHPPHEPFQKPGPYTTAEEYEALLTWDARAVTGSPNVSTPDSMNLGSEEYYRNTNKPWFGIIVYGKGKFKVYGNWKTDVESLKRTCIK